MSESQLDTFLRENTSASAPPQEPAQPPPAPPAPPTPTPAPTPSSTPPAPPAKPPETKPEEPDEDAALAEHVQGGDNRSVPFSALEKVRNDWKSKHAAEKAKADLLTQQLEEFKRQQAAPPPQQQPQVQYQPPPDPAIDPVGAFRYLQMEHQRNLLNERLNMSEALITDKIGKPELDKYVADFKTHADNDPSLWGKLYGQASPYAWMTKEVDRLRAHADIGDDPAAYRARVASEERAKWQAEMAAQQQTQQVSPAAGLPPSLATARSVAGRSAPVWTGETSLEDMVAGIRNRKAARR
jgi:hypothetical protein